MERRMSHLPNKSEYKMATEYKFPIEHTNVTLSLFLRDGSSQKFTKTH